MPRKPDPTRKPELLGQILDHLTGRTLATVSFRTLAEALGVSTYVFVYHFGNRAQLVQEIVRAIVARQADLLAVDAASLDAAGWRDHMGDAWAELTTPHNLQLQRLEFEAAMLETVAGDGAGVARNAGASWRQLTATWLESQGVDSGRAELDGALFADTVLGLQYDALASGDIERASRAFDRHVEAFLERAGVAVPA